MLSVMGFAKESLVKTEPNATAVVTVSQTAFIMSKWKNWILLFDPALIIVNMRAIPLVERVTENEISNTRAQRRVQGAQPV